MVGNKSDGNRVKSCRRKVYGNKSDGSKVM